MLNKKRSLPHNVLNVIIKLIHMYLHKNLILLGNNLPRNMLNLRINNNLNMLRLHKAQYKANIILNEHTKINQKIPRNFSLLFDQAALVELLFQGVRKQVSRLQLLLLPLTQFGHVFCEDVGKGDGGWERLEF